MSLVGYGRLLNLPITVSSTYSCADFKTSYIQTKGKCLLFQYLPISIQISGYIQVYIRNEDLQMELIKSVNFSDLPTDFVSQWQNLIVKLPDSDELRQIIVKGVKALNTFSGMAIDDFTIRPCSDLSKFRKLTFL